MYDKEAEKRMKREMRVFKGEDYAVGFLIGAIVGIGTIIAILKLHVFAEELVIQLAFIDDELDLRPLIAPAVGAFAAFAFMLVGMMWSRNHRDKKNSRK